MVLKSKVGVAKKDTKSLRSTIPEGIAEYLGVKAGDELAWYMARKRRQAIVMKAEEGVT